MSDREYQARPIVGIGIVVLRGDEVLICRRGKPPNVGSWTLPGGAQDIGETCKDAARRELQEETGLLVADLHFCDYVDTVRRDGDGRVRFHYTILDFCAAYAGGEAVAGSDVSEVRWVPIDELGPYALWTEAHRIIGIARGILNP